MRIVFVARNIPIPGSRENDIIVRIARRLRARGHVVSILYPAEWLPVPPRALRGKAAAVAALGQRFEVEDQQVWVARYLRLPTRSLGYALCERYHLPRPLIRSLAAFTPDVIHAHHLLPDGAMALRLGRWLDRPVVCSVRQGDANKLQSTRRWSPVGRLYARTLAAVDEITAPSVAVARQLERRGRRVRVIPHGVEQIPLRPPRGAADVIDVVCASRLLAQKNVAWVVRALDRYPGSRSVRLNVYGDGPERAAIEALAARCRHPVTVHGHVSRDVVLAAMRRAHVFALPSRRETFGMVYLEAARCGCCLLGLEGTGLHGMLADGVEATFCADSETSFAAALHRLIDSDEARVATARAGQALVAREFTWRRVCEAYESLYASLMA